MASTSRSTPRLVRNSQEVKNIKTDVVISDSDSDDEFYSNYVGRKLQEEEIAGLQAEPIVLNFQDDLGIDKDDLDLSDMSDLEDEEVPFEIQLANKAKKQREALKKKLDKELNSIVDVCLKQSRGVTNHVNSLADLEQLQEDVAHMKCVQKRVADNVTLGCSYTKTKRTSDVAPVKSSNESRVVFKINDLDDYRFCKTKLTWGIDSTFGELRKYIAERRQSSVKATSLTINSHEIEDDKTPGDMQLNPDMVHTIDVLTVGDDEPELLTLKCIQKNDKPIVIHVDKSEKFSKIAEMIREKGAIFTKMLFDHDEVAANSTPSDLDMEDEDQLDLL